jgi:hypothetical protein
VRLITPLKIADGQVTRNEANVSPMMMPTYFARSPSSILMAIKFIATKSRVVRSTRLALLC